MKVVYIEPYPKSKASYLHDDATSIDEELPGRVPIVPLLGIGPRRYLDLFSLRLSAGYPIERKSNSKLIEWCRPTATPRI
jgi:hypothetical protein